MVEPRYPVALGAVFPPGADMVVTAVWDTPATVEARTIPGGDPVWSTVLAESPAQLSSMGFSVAGSVVKDEGFAQQESGIPRQDVNEGHNGGADIFTDYFYDYHDLLEAEGTMMSTYFRSRGSTLRSGRCCRARSTRP